MNMNNNKEIYWCCLVSDDDTELGKMITSEFCVYRHKFVRSHQVLGMLGLPFSSFGFTLDLIWQLLPWSAFGCKSRISEL